MSEKDDIIEYLKSQIEREQRQADERVKEAVERERRERERANNYELELSDLRKNHESLVQKLLPEATQSPKPGFFSRLFGRGR